MANRYDEPLPRPMKTG